MALAYANPAGSAVLLASLYTAVWKGHALHCIDFFMYGVDLVILLIREGFVGGYGGREKIFCFRN